ncbi:MAG: translation initiation factor IF-3 [Clostridia bacterium]|nr:translation initiation factor IF-3 [Clostridia bacterium]
MIPQQRVYLLCEYGFLSVLCFFSQFYRRCFRIATKDLQLNEEIRDREVRVVSADGEQLGIMSAANALRLAEEKQLDLVKIAPQAKPPVCKIMDYGKYRFELQKREKESRKNQHVIDIKEVQLSLNIDTHDLETKVNNARRFLTKGNKVKVSIRFRGREMAHPERGVEIMEKFASYLTDVSVVEKPAKMESRTMLMFLAARPTK